MAKSKRTIERIQSQQGSSSARAAGHGRSSSALLALALGIAFVSSFAAQDAGAQKADSAAAGAPSGMQQMMNDSLDEIPSGKEGVDRIVGELTEQLTLTPEQQGEVRPVVTDTVAQMEKIRDRFKAGEITAMAMGMQMQMATQKSAVLIEPILTEEQQVTYAGLRQEQRRQMMQRLRDAQKAAQASGGTAGAQ